MILNTTTIIGLIAAVCTTASFLPQAIQTIKTKDTKGISLSMYTLFTVGTILWLVYGILSTSYPIIVANIVTVILALIILTYKIKYK